MVLTTLADVRALIGHLPKETRAKSTWRYVEDELKKAAVSGATMRVSVVAVQVVLQLEHVKYLSAVK
jgi:hypothetical protein